jgi:hypothetical protein
LGRNGIRNIRDTPHARPDWGWDWDCPNFAAERRDRIRSQCERCGLLKLPRHLPLKVGGEECRILVVYGATIEVSMDTMHIAITASLKPFVENQAVSKGYSSPAKYVESLLLDLERREREQKDLHQKLREGLQSPLIEADEAFWRELEREILAEHPELLSCDE